MSAFRPATGLVVGGGGGGGGGVFQVKDGVIQPINKYTDANMMVNGEFQAAEIEVISDMIFKSDIKDIEKSIVDKFDLIAPKQYFFKKDEKKERAHYGFIAQDFEKVFPNLVIKRKDNTRVVNYLEMIPLLLMKIQNMQKEINKLKNK
jgi:trimeric autotransporter adhesin